jgi:hypothetical protein
MNRVLVIDQDRATREQLGLACLGRNVGVALAENLCEGVRVLLSLPVSLVVADVSALRLSLLVTVAPDASLESRVALELAGFRVLSRPVTVEDLIDKAAV